MEKLQYPVGRFIYQAFNEAQRAAYIDTIRQLPQRLRTVAAGLSAQQLEQAYRPGGWTARQVIHHMADSHMNAYIRFKLILTENHPTIKPYNEKAWAELFDTQKALLEASFQILEGVHERWVSLLENITGEEWNRTGFHPEQQRAMSLMEFLALYEWHCRHHLAHISLVAQNLNPIFL